MLVLLLSLSICIYILLPTIKSTHMFSHFNKMKFHFHFHLGFVMILLLWRGGSTQAPYSCDSSDPRTKSFRFCQTSLAIHERVNDLVSRLTLDEKISQLVSSAPAIPRLGVSAYEWWSEALHGVSYYGKGITFRGKISGATSFPQVILSASTFDSHLWYRIGQVSHFKI